MQSKIKKTILITIILCTIVLVMLIINLFLQQPYQHFQQNIPLKQQVKSLVVKTGGADVQINIKSSSANDMDLAGYLPVNMIQSPEHLSNQHSTSLILDFAKKSHNIGLISNKNNPNIRLTLSANQLQQLAHFSVNSDGGSITLHNTSTKKLRYHANLNGGQLYQHNSKYYQLGKQFLLQSNGGNLHID